MPTSIDPDTCARALLEERFGVAWDTRFGLWLVYQHLRATGRIVFVEATRMPRPAAFCRTLFGWEIHLRVGLPPHAERFLFAHELAEYWLDELLVRGEGREALANRIAAALVAPKPLFLEALVRYGRDFATLAAEFGATQTCVARRYSEATGEFLALITPTRVEVLGGPFELPPDDVLRRLVESNTLPPELERLRLTDRRRRWALVETWQQTYPTENGAGDLGPWVN